MKPKLIELIEEIDKEIEDEKDTLLAWIPQILCLDAPHLRGQGVPLLSQVRQAGSEEKKMRLAIVEWVDSSCKYGWQSKDNIESATQVICASVGIIHPYPDCIKVVQTTSQDEVINIMTIPRCAIKRIRYLRIK